ncbi:MAG: hypothetical protein JW810_14385, partial [Sedimentisphaerales bacterium]|nr:hypothetical protein [Sedimentisphaerales bacterium]
MITKPTVLILGAGASMPYGFPSGEGMVRRICTLSSFYHKLFGPNISMSLESVLDHDEFANFTQLLSESQVSVDAFIESRREFYDIGRKAIAMALLPSEKSRSLSRRQLSDLEWDLYQLKPESWYQSLWSQMTSTPFSLDSFKKN